MKKLVALSLCLVIVLGMLLTGCGGGGEYPSKSIELIVPFAAGGGTDAVARSAAEAMKKELGQEVVVSNKTGGGGAIGMQAGLDAKADGYTVTMVTREVVSLPLLGQAPFKSEDFKYIGLINIDPTVLVVPVDSPYQTAEELFDAIKAAPGKLIFAASVVPNFYGATITQATGMEFQTIAFDGAAPAITELMGGRADFGLYGPGEIKAQMDAGKLKPLAVMAAERFSGLPEVPTFAELGYEAHSGTFRGFAVPMDTPDDVTARLEAAIAKVAEDPDFVKFMSDSFYGLSYKNAAEFKDYVATDKTILAPVIETLS